MGYYSAILSHTLMLFLLTGRSDIRYTYGLGAGLAVGYGGLTATILGMATEEPESEFYVAGYGLSLLLTGAFIWAGMHLRVNKDKIDKYKRYVDIVKYLVKIISNLLKRSLSGINSLIDLIAQGTMIVVLYIDSLFTMRLLLGVKGSGRRPTVAPGTKTLLKAYGALTLIIGLGIFVYYGGKGLNLLFNNN